MGMVFLSLVTLLLGCNVPEPTSEGETGLYQRENLLVPWSGSLQNQGFCVMFVLSSLCGLWYIIILTQTYNVFPLTRIVKFFLGGSVTTV